MLVEDGMAVGLGTGSTAGYFISALAARRLDIRCVATSPASAAQAAGLGLRVEAFEDSDAPTRLDLAVDGADQVAADRWVVKGNGGAHTREKIVAAASERFVLIASSDKVVDRITAPIPLELLVFGADATIARLVHVRRRDAARTPDGGLLVDWIGPVEDPAELARRLSAEPGVVDHGLFPPELVTDVLVGRGDEVERLPDVPRP